MFELYFQNFSCGKNYILGRIIVDLQPKSRSDPSPLIAQIQERSQSIHCASLGVILVDLQLKSRSDPRRFIVEIQERSQSIHCANLGVILVDLQLKSRKDPSQFIASIQEGSQSIHLRQSRNIPRQNTSRNLEKSF